jgi:hypothetical protein
MARGRRKNGKIQMPPNGKKEPLENLKDKFRSFFSVKNPQGKKKALPLKAHFSIWYHLYCYGKERSQFNCFKKE